eukprot:g83004.t1
MKHPQLCEREDSVRQAPTGQPDVGRGNILEQQAWKQWSATSVRSAAAKPATGGCAAGLMICACTPPAGSHQTPEKGTGRIWAQARLAKAGCCKTWPDLLVKNICAPLNWHSGYCRLLGLTELHNPHVAWELCHFRNSCFHGHGSLRTYGLLSHNGSLRTCLTSYTCLTYMCLTSLYVSLLTWPRDALGQMLPKCRHLDR